jgi:hypothetical protein
MLGAELLTAHFKLAGVPTSENARIFAGNRKASSPSPRERTEVRVPFYAIKSRR